MLTLFPILMKVFACLEMYINMCFHLCTCKYIRATNGRHLLSKWATIYSRNLKNTGSRLCRLDQLSSGGSVSHKCGGNVTIYNFVTLSGRILNQCLRCCYAQTRHKIANKNSEVDMYTIMVIMELLSYKGPLPRWHSQ